MNLSIAKNTCANSVFFNVKMTVALQTFTIIILPLKMQLHLDSQDTVQMLTFDVSVALIG